MKKQYLIYIFLINFFYGFSQNASVEKNLFGLQLGLLNAGIHNEVKLTRLFSIKAEAILNTGFYINSDGTDILFAPAVRLEPRYYFGLDRRQSKGKNIKNNGANFFSLKTMYQTDLLFGKDADKLAIVPFFGIGPNFGIRRNFADNFNYEFGFGFRYQQNLGTYNKDSRIFPDLKASIGFDF